MVNSISLPYLSDLVPATIDGSSNYNLRNSDNIHLVIACTSLYNNSFLACTSLYNNSFLPSTVLDLNNIPDENRNADTIMAFTCKNALSRDKPVVPIHHFLGNWKQQNLHTRLRTNYSGLNNDLYLKI